MSNPYFTIDAAPSAPPAPKLTSAEAIAELRAAAIEQIQTLIYDQQRTQQYKAAEDTQRLLERIKAMDDDQFLNHLRGDLI